MRYIVVIVSALLLMMSCDDTSRKLEDALSLAGQNRDELESLVNYYDSIGDERKHKAAEFLITNMVGLYSAEGDELERYYHDLDSVYEACDSNYMNIYVYYRKNLKNYKWRELTRSYDLENIDTAFLRDNIERAIAVYDTSMYAKGLSFDDFCEMILPYRNNNELLEYWRKDYVESYSDVIGRFDAQADSVLFDLCWELNKLYKAHNYMYPAGMPSISPIRLKRTLIAPCSDYTDLFINIARTFGIPVVHDFVPQWSNYPHGHGWAAIMIDGVPHDYMLGEGSYLKEHMRKFSNVVSKVFRQTYALQPTSLYMTAKDRRNIPPTMSNPRMYDVTEQYMPTIDIELKDLREVEDQEYVYLTVFDNKDWNAIDWAEINGDEVKFDKVGIKKEAVFLPAYYNGGIYTQAHCPIRVKTDGSVEYLRADTTERRRVVLKRKYFETRVNLFLRNIKGCKLVLSDNRNFEGGAEYIVPDTIECNYQTWEVSGKYRYLRFTPDTLFDGQVSDIEVYDDLGNEIKGKPISSGLVDTMRTEVKVFDENTLTYGSCRKRSVDWLGLDFGRMVDVSKVCYLPRNDDNFIREGQEYELYYWDSGWHSLGRKVGSRREQKLEYDNVPFNALLLLRNHTKGKEERIFVYEEGRQVWF